MSKPSVEEENRAGIGRVTCGWKKAHLPLDVVRRYWRDVHSPGIARRPGLYEYRHLQYDAVRTDVFAPIAGIDFDAPVGQQLMWTSDVRYLDDAALAAFSGEPVGDVRRHLLGDIDLIVDQSTTYLVLGSKGTTFVDRSAEAAPQGPSPLPTFSIFVRQRGDEAAFRECLSEVSRELATRDAVIRWRLSLFEVPDMEAERKAGYPIKTHPQPLQYQAWIDATLANEGAARPLFDSAIAKRLAAEVKTLHAYPVPVVYTSVCRGRPTLVGLRGYPAHDAIEALKAANQKQPALLQWMYGPVVGEGPLA